MQQRFGIRGRVKVARLPPEHEVRDERRRSADVLQQLHVLVGHEHEPAEYPARDEDDRKRRKNPAYPSRVEIAEAECTGAEVVEDDPGDQKSGDHEEDVHPNEAARHEPR